MDKAKKKRVKRYISWACMAAVVALLTVMPLMAKTEAEADGPVASVLSAQAEKQDIQTALHGGGTLEAQDEKDVTIPVDVKITEFLVKNGDYVTAGTPLATVDKVSVMTAITEVNETMDYLRDKLEDARDEEVDSTIYATAGGRVKKIFAQTGESVQEVMLRDGALAVLSIDGMMAVKLEVPSGIATGESVDVTFPDGTSTTGRVESNLNGVVIVTVEDEGYAIGETVSVGDLGSGQLYIHNAWKVTAYSGTIETIKAREETTLSSGSAIFTLSDTDYTGELQRRANQHREYEELLQKLLKMYESGVIEAPCDGVVSGVDEDSTHLLSAEGEWEASLLNHTQGEYRIVFLSSVSTEFEVDESFTCDCNDECKGPKHNPACPKACTGDEACKGTNHQDSCIKRCTRGIGCPATNHYIDCITHCTHAETAEKCNALTHYSDCIHSCTNAVEEGKCGGSKHHYLTCIESCVSSDGTKDCPATKTHKKSCIERCSHADISGVCEGEAHHYTDCVESCIVSASAEQVCPASKHKDGCHFLGMTYTATASKVFAVGTTELVVYRDTSTVYTAEKNGSGWSITPALNRDLFLTPDTIPTSSPAGYQQNDIILHITGYKNGEADWSGMAVYERSSGSSTGIPGIGNVDLSGMLGGMNLSGMTGGFSGYGNYSAGTQTKDEGLYDLNGSTLLTVTPQNSMVLTVTLDEQDISRVSPGMTAEVKVEALRGQTFPAEITKIGTSGENNGGSSKFTVEMTLEASQDMLSGMSATAKIPMEIKNEVLTIPVAALTGSGSKTLVCTALDEKTGDPGSPVEVEIGLSDGESVEILSGLKEGDTVYYSYYDTLELDTSAEASRFTFG